MWLSTDPALGEYIPGLDKDKNKNLPGMGGLFNPINANLFCTFGNNPIKYVDPDGRETNSYWTDGSSALKNVLEKAEEITEENLPPKPSGNSIKRMGFWGALFYFCNNVLQSDSIPSPPLPPNFERCGDGNIYAPNGTVMVTYAQAWALYNGDPNWDEADGCWGKGTFDSVTKSLQYHFTEHGREVGAATMEQYINKAKEFKQNLKRAQGPFMSLNNLGEHTGWKYIKNNKYIILDLNKDKILSFGSKNHVKE